MLTKKKGGEAGGGGGCKCELATKAERKNM